MNKKLYTRLILDFIMAVIMIVLMGYAVSGPLWHEILGVMVLVLIIVHNLINIRWFTSVIKNRSGKPGYQIYLRLIINIIMLADTVLLGISSVMISKILFSGLSLSHSGDWKYIHTLTAYTMLIMISIHIGLHWKMIMNAVRSIFHINGSSAVRTVILRILALLFAILGVKASFDRGIAAKFIPGGQRHNTGRNSALNENYQTEAGDLKGKGRHGEEYKVRSFAGTTIDENETLNDFLKRLTCTGCGRQCSLISPSCSNGSSQAAQATSYYESYSSKENDNSVVFEVDSNKDDTLIKLFSEYIPIMGMYIAGTYYTLKIIDTAKKKKIGGIV